MPPSICMGCHRSGEVSQVSLLERQHWFVFQDLNFTALESEILFRPLLLVDTCLKSYYFHLHATAMLWPQPTDPEVSGKLFRGLLVRDENPEWRKVSAVWLKDSQNLGLRGTIRSRSWATCPPCTPVHPHMLAVGSGTHSSLKYLFLSHVSARWKHPLLIPPNCILQYSHFPVLSLLNFQPLICRHFSQPLSNFYCFSLLSPPLWHPQWSCDYQHQIHCHRSEPCSLLITRLFIQARIMSLALTMHFQWEIITASKRLSSIS